ncbi:MAG: aspartate-semialdehyde dehydrogenase [Proteobacteria bacterium]|nr:aspartate-semialdehyde dehydrogenase [Pseudomonadota bacterium]
MISKKAHVAVVGATGAVGREMIHCLEALAFPVGKLDLVASSRSAGMAVETPWGCCVVQDAALYDFSNVDIALFSAGKKVSLELAPKAVKAGALVIDNTSAFRLDADKALVVPEVNGEQIDFSPRIIANPNCSTIQMVLALAALDRAVGVDYVRVATYQSCSGAGQKGINALYDETRASLEGKRPEKSAVHARTIAFDVVPQIGAFEADGFSEEEHKMMAETKKILSRPDLPVSATCVRVPVARCHSEVVHVGLKKSLSVREAADILDRMPGLRVTDKTDVLAYPTAIQGEGDFDTLVGRIRIDPVDQGLIFWIVSDNLLKGAALNAVQIACAAWNHGRMDSNEV